VDTSAGVLVTGVAWVAVLTATGRPFEVKFIGTVNTLDLFRKETSDWRSFLPVRTASDKKALSRKL
jgi:hypothetical protein